ncbi:hypothetical protein F4680DRAFT_454268 [Xylaria scruposa]|nr:hypothetical protein F4680DRAFT_454268 [Xylaria scruposa]
MKLLAIITLQAALGFVSGAPAPNDCLVKQRSKIKSCNGFSIDTGLVPAYLHAECHGYDDKAGKWDKVETGMGLNKCLANVEGYLVGRENGNFEKRCRDPSIAQDATSGAVIMTAMCQGPLIEAKTSIDLGQVITVENGDLVCFGQKEKPCDTCRQPE